MSTVADAYVSLVPSFKGGGKAISNALGNAPDQGGRQAGTTAGRGFLSSFGGVAKKVAGVAAIAGIGVSIGGTLKAGLSRVTTIQNASVALEKILGSQTKAAAFSAKIMKTVTGTPFNLDQFMTASKNLAAFGVQADKIPKILTGIGDAAAASGKGAEGVGQLVDVFGKMAAQGKVSLDQVWQISDTGVPALQILANHFGVTTAEMQKMVSAGAVPAGEAIDALTAGIENGSSGVAGATVKFGGSMAALRKTFDGALGGFKASFARLGASIVSPLLDPMTAGLNGATAGVDKITAAMKPRMVALVSGVQATLKPLAPTLHVLKSVFVDGFSQIWYAAGPIVEALTGSVKGAGSKLAGPLTGLAGLLKGVFGQVANVVNGVAQALGPVLSTLGPALGQVFSMLSPIGLAFKALAPVLPQIGSALQVVAQALVTGLAEALKAVAPVLPVVVQALTTVAAAVAGALVVAVKKLAPLLPPIAKLLGQIASVVGQALAKALTALAPILAKVITLLADIASRILSALLPVMPQLVAAFGKILDALVPLLPVLLQLIVQGLQPTLAAVTLLLPPVVKLAAFLAGALATAVAGLIRGLTAVASVFAAVQKAVSVTASWVVARVADIVNAVTGIPGRIGAAARTMFDGVKNAITGAKNWVGDRVADIVSGIGSIPSKILALAGRMLDAGKRLMGSLWDGIKSAASSAGRFVGGVVDDIANGIKNALNDLLHLPWKLPKIGLGPLGSVGGQTILPRLAVGGPLRAGQLARVNERGQEMFMPAVDGRVLTAQQTRDLVRGNRGGGRSVEITNHIYEVTDAAGTAMAVGRRQARQLEAL